MLLNLINDGFSTNAIISFLLFLPTLLISLTVHEYSHGYVAYRCGDNTAMWNGRLTLNPLKHLDPIGTIMMLFFGFGYAKPVPINPRNFKNYRRDLCLVALAGPVSNLLLALLGMIVLYVSLLFMPNNFISITSSSLRYYVTTSNFSLLYTNFILTFIISNITLAVFNLLPIPPLDGSRIISSLLSGELAYYYNKYENIIMLVVFVLLAKGVLSAPINIAADFIAKGFEMIIELLPVFKDVAKIINF